jgi:hypothetical protein
MRNRLITSPSYQTLIKTRFDKLTQKHHETELNKLYENVVKQQLDTVGLDSRRVKLNTFAVKYLGITDGKIGILSRKVPI